MRGTLPGFELDLQRSRLLRDGREVELEPKVFDLLCYLLEHPHRLIGKEELKREVWRAQRLSDGVTSNAIAKLRRALGQPGEAAVPIETIRGRGYIFHLPEASRDADTTTGRTIGAAVDAQEPDPFVGRAGPLETLTKKLERARAGAAALVLIGGPAGIGKTRLVKELMRGAGADGTKAWLGAAYEGEGFPPYWPWMQIVREAQRSEPSAFARALPQGADVLSHWVTGLGPLPPAAEGLDPQTLRFRLFDQLTRCLRALAADGLKLVVLDDLQWADAGSIDLLGHSVRALASSPILFVATLRDEEPFTRSVDESVSKMSRIATRVRLGGLSEEESRTLAEELRSGRLPPEAQLRELFQRSEGNPFFIRQFVEWWSEGGANLGQRDELPPGARDIARRRLALLPSQSRRVLTAASVLGAQFRASRLTEILGEPPNTALEALASASRLGLVAAVPGTDEFAFTHALLQECLYRDADLQTRGALHSRAADSFGSDSISDSTGQLGERARHLVHALPSRLEEAVRACEGAARASLRSAGFERASDLLSLAIAKLEAEQAPLHEQARLWIELGDSHFLAAELDVAWRAYCRAAELLRAAGSAEGLASLVPLMVRCVNLGAGDSDFARVLVEEVLSSLPPQALRERGCTLAKKAQLALELSTDERNALLEQATACVDDPLVRLEVAYTRNLLRDPSTLERNAQAATDFLALVDTETQDPTALRYRTLNRISAYMTRYLCAATSCDLNAADEAQAGLARIAETTHLRGAEVILLIIRAGRALAAGRLEELAAIVTGSVAVANDSFAISEALRSYQLLLLEARGAMAVLERVEPPASPEGMAGTLRQRTDLALSHAYLFVRTGRKERARALLEHLPRRDIDRMPVLYGDLGALSGLATIYAELGDAPGMRMVYEKLLPFAGRNALLATFAWRGAVDHFLGMLAEKLGDRERARGHLQAAVEINSRLGMPVNTAASAALLASLG